MYEKVLLRKSRIDCFLPLWHPFSLVPANYLWSTSPVLEAVWADPGAIVGGCWQQVSAHLSVMLWKAFLLCVEYWMKRDYFLTLSHSKRLWFWVSYVNFWPKWLILGYALWPVDLWISLVSVNLGTIRAWDYHIPRRPLFCLPQGNPWGTEIGWMQVSQLPYFFIILVFALYTFRWKSHPRNISLPHLFKKISSRKKAQLYILYSSGSSPQHQDVLLNI